MSIVGAISYSGAASNPYTATGTCTIDHTQCGTADSTNFTVIVSATNTKLKQLAGGGDVTNASGFDIVFTSDSGATTLMPGWTMKSYDGTAGTIVAEVLVPTVSHLSNVIFYIQVGNAAITTFQGGATGAAWDTNFKAVWMLGNGTTLDLTDNSGNGQNGTNNGASAAAGNVDGCASFPITKDKSIQVANLFNIIGGSTTHTIELWFKTGGTDLSSSPTLFDLETGAASLSSLLETDSNVGFFWGYANTFRTYTGISMSNGTWYNVIVEKTGSGNNGNLYFNGVLQSTFSGSFGNPANSGTGLLGQFHSGGGVFGFESQFKISNIARGANYALVRYNSENNPASFVTVVL